MVVSKREAAFKTTEEGEWSLKTLQAMEKDAAFVSDSSFTADAEHYPDNRMPFITTHMNFLAKHPEVNPRQYIANLRLRSRKGRS